MLSFELVENLDPNFLDQLRAFYQILLLSINNLAYLGEVASEGRLFLDLDEKNREILFIFFLNYHLYCLLDISSVLKNNNFAGNLFLPVDDPLLLINKSKNLVFKALNELWVHRNVLDDEDNIQINRVLILLRELSDKGQLQKAFFCHLLQGLVKLNYSLIHQQLLIILPDDRFRKSKRL